MLCLSGFELYSRWMPLMFCVLLNLLFFNFSRDTVEGVSHLENTQIKTLNIEMKTCLAFVRPGN